MKIANMDDPKTPIAHHCRRSASLKQLYKMKPHAKKIIHRSTYAAYDAAKPTHNTHNTGRKIIGTFLRERFNT